MKTILTQESRYSEGEIERLDSTWGSFRWRTRSRVWTSHCSHHSLQVRWEVLKVWCNEERSNSFLETLLVLKSSRCHERLRSPSKKSWSCLFDLESLFLKSSRETGWKDDVHCLKEEQKVRGRVDSMLTSIEREEGKKRSYFCTRLLSQSILSGVSVSQEPPPVLLTSYNWQPIEALSPNRAQYTWEVQYASLIQEEDLWIHSVKQTSL